MFSLSHSPEKQLVGERSWGEHQAETSQARSSQHWNHHLLGGFPCAACDVLLYHMKRTENVEFRAAWLFPVDSCYFGSEVKRGAMPWAGALRHPAMGRAAPACGAAPGHHCRATEVTLRHSPSPLMCWKESTQSKSWRPELREGQCGSRSIHSHVKN